MIRLAEVIDTFLPELERDYACRLLSGQRQALSAIARCRTPASGTAVIHWRDCGSHEVVPLSCGHRFCPQCQHAAGELWLERQRAKLLPVDYYMITFTLPAPLRGLVYDHQREAYDLLIRLAWETLAGFGSRDKTLHGDLGATVVLHTHTRALDFHPRVHVVLPAGAIDTAARQWRTKGGKFLFPQKALAKVFRGKWFQAMQERGWSVMATVPKQWVADCTRVGNGEKGEYRGRGNTGDANTGDGTNTGDGPGRIPGTDQDEYREYRGRTTVFRIPGTPNTGANTGDGPRFSEYRGRRIPGTAEYRGRRIPGTDHGFLVTAVDRADSDRVVVSSVGRGNTGDGEYRGGNTGDGPRFSGYSGRSSRFGSGGCFLGRPDIPDHVRRPTIAAICRWKRGLPKTNPPFVASRSATSMSSGIRSANKSR